ncbi:MAG: prepilin-type N-terminal cleavage/methylation domain-containing protein [Alphaproteobacteria bacterium]
MSRPPSRAAFSLVELSIVLAIVALIAGGITIGRALITSGGDRALIGDIERYDQAVDSFQEKYSALPGDFSTAANYWGQDTATACSTAPASADRVPKKKTCNGNGSGQLGDSGVEYETFGAWVQLADAGFISGSFTGTTGAGGVVNAVIGENVPPTKLEGVGMAFMTYVGDGFTDPSTMFYAGDYGTATLIVGSEDGVGILLKPALTVTDSWNIDTKLDDGMPQSGRIKPILYNSPNCVTGTAYNLTYTTGPACALTVNVTG